MNRHDEGRAARLEAVRQRIRVLERLGGAAHGVAVSLGAPAIDAALPGGGLAAGCLHEIVGADAVATALAALMAGRFAAARGPAGRILWVAGAVDLYPPGLGRYGLSAGRLVQVTVSRPKARLWALEEAVRSGAPAAVVGEVADMAPVAARRLQLAAEAGGVPVLVLPRGEAAGGASPAVTRWQVANLPSVADGLPGVGAECWRLELVRCRGGRPDGWTVMPSAVAGLTVWEDDGEGVGIKGIGTRKGVRSLHGVKGSDPFSSSDPFISAA